MIELSQNISDYILKNFGADYLAHYREYSAGEYKPFIRLSSTGPSEEKIIAGLKAYGIEIEKVAGVKNAYSVLKEESLVGKTLEFILGAYYIQSLSSMIPALVLNASHNDRVLDLCAAPGSKTTQLAEMMQNGGTLVANEISMERVKSLVFNIDKMNLYNVGVIHGKGELLGKKFENFFDKILVDAPCSALGIVQKKGEVSTWWNETKAQSLAEIQYRLLVSAIKMVRPQGEIVYSTCTLTLEENELVLDKILRKYPVSLADIDLPVKSINAFTEAGGLKLDPSIVKAKRILPWEIGSEGFFVAKLVKNEPDDSARPVKDSFDKTAFVNSNSQKIKKYFDAISSYYGIDRSEFDRFKYIVRSKDIYFINWEWAAHSLDSFLRLGSKFGIIDKHDFLQLNSLAVQVLADKIKSNIVELKLKSELDTYFKGGTIKDFPSSPGPKVVKYGDFYLGSASSTKEGLKSQFPRHFRTQEILLK